MSGIRDKISQECIQEFMELFKDVLTISSTTPPDIKTKLQSY